MRLVLLAKRLWKAAAGAPLRVRLVLLLVLLYLASPIDLIPDFIPVLGQLDDLIVIAWLMRYIDKHVPELRDALKFSWKEKV